MFKLDDDNFRQLLEDLYSLYAPKKLSTIDRIASKYGDSYENQRNAIQTAYTLYNKPRSPYYNPDLGTESYITGIMEDYQNGNRVLSHDDIINTKPSELDKQKELIKDLESEISNIKKSGATKKEENTLNSIQVECDIPNVAFLENENYLTTLSIGQRIVCPHPDKEKNEVIGLEVEDINDDFFSSPDNKPIRLMKIKKV